MYKDFLVKELDIEIDLNYALDYLDTLESEYAHLRWNADTEISSVKDAELQDNIKGVYGWGLQSNLEDLNQPCPPYNIHKKGSDVYRNTTLIFGFAKWVLDQFPYARQMSVAAHPPGTRIRTHTDTDTWLKVHIPLLTTDNSYFIFDDTKFVLEAGKVYLVNTTVPHSTSNEGSDIRTHLFFKIPADIEI